jgi:hypothetical protein
MAAITDRRKMFSQIVWHNRPASSKSILAAIVFYYGDAFLIVESMTFHLSPDDILVLANNAYPAMESLENTWTPICLPTHEQMLHILTCDVKAFSFKVIFISDQIDAYAKCTQMAERIEQKIDTDERKSQN